MKETSQKLYKVVFQETLVQTMTYEVLAESEDNAKTIVSDGGWTNKRKEISRDVIVLSNNVVTA